MTAYCESRDKECPLSSPIVMSDAELVDVRVFLAIVPEPPSVKDIPLLEAVDSSEVHDGGE